MTQTRLLALIALLTLVLGAPVASAASDKGRISRPTATSTPASSPVTTRCEAIRAYAREAVTLTPDLAPALQRAMDGGDVFALRPSQQRALVQVFDDWAEDLEDMDNVPAEVAAYHDARVDGLNASISAISAIASGNPEGSFFYISLIEDATDIMKRESDRIERACGFSLNNP